MPELPEVETTRNAILPHIMGKNIEKVFFFQKKLRYPINFDAKDVVEQQCLYVYRRAKYLILELTQGYILIHLGMSGSLRIHPGEFEKKKHDHVIFYFSNNLRLIYHDPRRFGFIKRFPPPLLNQSPLNHLGPEPQTDLFNDSYFYHVIHSSQRQIKVLMMDQKVVVGVGNIYATEALFLAKIHPSRKGHTLSKQEVFDLVDNIKRVLSHAIKQGGTTLRDFVSGKGETGYFQQHLYVYGREGLPCLKCKDTIKKLVIGQRTSAYCQTCQS
jgi:formamidopyrimidine-DNA glycosylase